MFGFLVTWGTTAIVAGSLMLLSALVLKAVERPILGKGSGYSSSIAIGNSSTTGPGGGGGSATNQSRTEQ